MIFASGGTDDGTWQRIHPTLRATMRRQGGRHQHPTAGALDSQCVKTPPVPGERGADSGKRGKGRKRYLLMDTLGWLLIVVVTTAAVSENAEARLVLNRQRPSGDAAGSLAAIVVPCWREPGYGGSGACAATAGQQGFVVQAHRWVVERTWVWLTRGRRLSAEQDTHFH